MNCVHLFQMKRALSDSDDDADFAKEAREQRQAARQKARNDPSDEELGEEEISRSEDEKIEPFNLAGEREEGEFDEGGFFVFSKKEETPDAWADEIGKSKIQFSAEKLKKMEDNAAAAAEFWASEERVPISRLVAEREICEILLPGETPRKAMNRLTGRVPGAKKKFPGPKMSPEATEKFKKLADACDAIAGNGFAEIYDTPREDLVFPGFRSILLISLKK